MAHHRLKRSILLGHTTVFATNAEILNANTFALNMLMLEGKASI